MASTARAEADCAEFFDDPKTLQTKIRRLAALIKASKHFCAFTGAGISTAAGIADFRSGIKTALDTGAGKWARQAAVKGGQASQIKKAKRKTKAIKAIPTRSHMALVSLMTSGPKYLKHLISQNTDGLHRRSGIPVHQLSELHGNSTLEVCNKCSRGYIRDYKTSRKNKKLSDKRTGRKCTVPLCGGVLCRTVVAFGQNLPERTFERAQNNADACDVMLSLGSSLTVTPAADMCEQVGEASMDEFARGVAQRHHLVVVNLQQTPMDHLCSLRIFAKIDDVMIGLMRELQLDIPEWHLQRLLKLEVAPMANSKSKHADGDERTLSVSAMDVDGICATVFQEPRLRNNGRELFAGATKRARRMREARQGKGMKRGVVQLVSQQTDVFVFNIPSELEMKAEDNDKDKEKDEDEESLMSPVHRRPSDDKTASPNSAAAAATAVAEVEAEVEVEKKVAEAEADAESGLVLDLGFFGHYGEPRLEILLNGPLSGIGEEGGEVVCRLTMDIASKEWDVELIDFVPLPVVKDIYSFTVKRK